MVNNIPINNQARNDGIDFLRGISILAVILLHCQIKMPFEHSILPLQLSTIILRSGYYGVIIFFVISGFLITTNVLKRWGSLQAIKPLLFYQMRFARIMPCLIALLAVFSILHWLHVADFIVTRSTLGRAIFSVLTFHFNWLQATLGWYPGCWSVLWSLSIEEMFYVIFPLACLTLRKPAIITLFMLVFIFLGPYARVVWSVDNDIWMDHAYLSGMDGIAIGCLAAMLAHRWQLSLKQYRFIFVTGLALFTLVFFFRHETAQLGLTQYGLNVTVLDISVGLLLIAMQEWYGVRQHTGSRAMAPIRWFGRHSYEIYLTHEFFVLIMAHYASKFSPSIPVLSVSYVLVVCASGVSGQLLASYFSEPMNRWIRRLNLVKTVTQYLPVRPY